MTIALLAVALPCHGARESPIRRLDVAYDGRTYVTDVVMFAPVPLEVAWEVLTDFGHMAEWVPNLRASRILQSAAGSVTIEQKGLAKFGVAEIPFVTERRVEMDRLQAIRSTQTKGNFRRFESLMQLASDGNGTRLTYHVEAVPSRLAAIVMSKRFLEHEIPEQFGPIIDEMIRRAH